MQPEAVARETGLGERPRAEPLMLGLDVDAGEHGVAAHARSSQTPDVPQPVPISTTALAPRAAAMKRRRRAHRRAHAEAPPTCAALRPRHEQGLVLGRNPRRRPR